MTEYLDLKKISGKDISMVDGYIIEGEKRFYNDIHSISAYDNVMKLHCKSGGIQLYIAEKSVSNRIEHFVLWTVVK